MATALDRLAVTVSSFVHDVEDLRLPVIPYGTYVKGLVIGIPVAVLLHDTAEHWLPTKFRIPIISYFRRRWRESAATKESDLHVIRDLIIFTFFIVLRMDSGANEEAQPSDYVEQRLTSAAGHRAMNSDIYKARRAAFNAADEVIGEEEMNMAGVQQQRDAVLRRRYLHDSRQGGTK